MTSQQIIDDRVRGWTAARAGQPFQDYQSRAWQEGWQQQREQVFRTIAAANVQEEIDALLIILRHASRKLAERGQLAADLAIAVVQMELAPAFGHAVPTPAPSNVTPLTQSKTA